MKGSIENLTGLSLIGENGTKYTLAEQVGCGAQGVVYEETRRQYMIKLYHPSNCQSIDRERLDRLRFIRSISMPKDFVSVVDVIARPYPGYVMEKVSGHKPLNTYLIPEKNLPFSRWYNKGLGLYERLFVGYIIAKAFAELEKSKLSYCDISGNNILVRIGKGASVKMIDVDNIYIPGKGAPSILGTPRYIAWEVIHRQKNPDVLSDNYALAVILFELLRVGHPYISDAVSDGSPEEEEAALAGAADYVTDAQSTYMLPADVVFTGKLKELFHRCFADGKKNRLSRPSATEFEYALLEASNKLIQCPSCEAWHYPLKRDGRFEGCPWCEAESKPTAMLNFYDVLYHGDDYQNAAAVGENPSGKQVNTYVLKRFRKNDIKSLYILRYEDLGKEKRSSENYLTIPHTAEGYYLYNQFAKSGIVLRRYRTGEYIRADSLEYLLLESGDEIYFEPGPSGAVGIECGGSRYAFIRMARFMEVKG